MTDNKKLIEEARDALAEVGEAAVRVYQATGVPLAETRVERSLRLLLAVFEKALTPTNADEVLSEREALVERYLGEHGHHADARHGFLSGLAAGFHRTEAPRVIERHDLVMPIYEDTEVPEPSAERPGPPVYLAADLWDALGAPTSEFDSYYARNGWADTWANLLGTVRDHFKPKCGHDTDGEPCVLTSGHLPPHYGASDVGRSEPVPVPEPQGEPSDAIPDDDQIAADNADWHTEYTEPQGEPSHVHVLAESDRRWPHTGNGGDLDHSRAVRRLSFRQGAEWMRAALRAAAKTGGA